MSARKRNTRNTRINEIVRNILTEAGWPVYRTHSDLRKSGIRRLAYKRNGFTLSDTDEQSALRQICSQLLMADIEHISAEWKTGVGGRGSYRYVAIEVNG